MTTILKKSHQLGMGGQRAKSSEYFQEATSRRGAHEIAAKKNSKKRSNGYLSSFAS